MRWDKQRHRELLLDRDERQQNLANLSQDMHDLYNSDGWDSKPKLTEKFIIMERQHAKQSRELEAVKRDIDRLELVKPKETKQLDDGSDVLLRFMERGNNGLESGEIEDHQASLSKTNMRMLPSKHVLDLSKIPARPDENSVTRLMNTQVVSDGAGTPTVQPVVQVNVLPTVIDRLMYYGGASRFAYQFNTPGDMRPVKHPMDDDLAMGEIQNNQRTSTGEQEAELTTIQFDVHRSSSKYIDMSLESFSDLGIDVDAWLRAKLVRRLGRVWDHALTNGSKSGAGGNTNGSALTLAANQFEGILEAIPGKINITSAKRADNLNLTWENLVSVQYEVNKAYRDGGEDGFGGFNPVGMGQVGYLIADETEKRVKLMKDGRNRPLWLPATGSAMSMFPGTIFGKPYAVLGSAPNPAGGNVIAGSGAVASRTFVAAFGHFGYYGIRNSMGPLLFNVMDAETIKTYATRYIAFWWRGARSVAEKHGGNYEYAAAIMSGNSAT